MIQVPRDDRSVIGQWWWTVDRWSLGAVLAILTIGLLGYHVWMARASFYTYGFKPYPALAPSIARRTVEPVATDSAA